MTHKSTHEFNLATSLASIVRSNKSIKLSSGRAFYLVQYSCDTYLRYLTIKRTLNDKNSSLLPCTVCQAPVRIENTLINGKKKKGLLINPYCSVDCLRDLNDMERASLKTPLTDTFVYCDICNLRYAISKRTKTNKGHFCGRRCQAIHFGRLSSLPDNVDPMVKFLSNLSPNLTDDECWEWQGALNHSNYGVFSPPGKGRPYGAHRFSFMHFNNRWDIKAKDFVCHTCDNPKCVNPHHLFLGTCKENMEDCVDKGRINRGENTHTNVLTEADVLEIRRLFSSGATAPQIHKVYPGIKIDSLYDIKGRRSWKHLP